ncbi:MAG: hypothetical protein IPG76_12055 [Acidobacteria bacterium]|nr:hypothetical protein [Acidobacteriota bacterium]
MKKFKRLLQTIIIALTIVTFSAATAVGDNSGDPQKPNTTQQSQTQQTSSNSIDIKMIIWMLLNGLL